MDKISPKLWSWASDIDPNAIQQALRASRLDIVTGHVALMPDAHVGIGATVGSVIPTENAVIPSAVGVDLGCGMIAARTSLIASGLPDDLQPYLSMVEEAIPAGVGRGHAMISRMADLFISGNPHPGLTSKQRDKALQQFGTLGSGNHFFEVCLDEIERVWIVLHSGSRGIGNELARGHIKVAKEMAKTFNMKLEDPDLAWLVQHTPEFDAYIFDMDWSQRYAFANRQAMLRAAVSKFFAFTGYGEIEDEINCHHNFTALEEFTWPPFTRQQKTLRITRKGAIKAALGDRGVIPGSMGTRSYIVRGLGNRDSWNSCAHGAGRRFSRRAAKENFTTADLAKAMEGKVWLADRGAALLDEIPGAYKDVDQVMEDQKDLVEVEHVLRQVLNYKGV